MRKETTENEGNKGLPDTFYTNFKRKPPNIDFNANV